MSNMSTASWSIGRRVGVRFGVLAGALLIFPFPLYVIPRSDGVVRWLNKPMSWAVRWFAENALGLAEPSSQFDGSGDKTWDYVHLVVIAILAVIGTVIWSVADRRRAAYPRLAAAALVTLRYVLGYAMLSYGFSKIFKSQFPDLRPGDLDKRLGEMAPMTLAWSFMGYSTPYTVFSGLAEVIGGVLVLWRRTATIGALVIVVVMTNVVMLNFCYDIPVKLFSARLLVIAVVIAAPSARRLIAAAMGRATPDLPARERMHPRWEHARQIARISMLVLFAWAIYDERTREAGANDHVHELYGAWVVDTFIVDGVEHALATDPDRWQKVLANQYGLHIAPMSGEFTAFRIDVDAAHGTLTLNVPAHSPDSDQAKPNMIDEIWRYRRPAPDHLVLDGVHLGKAFHATLHLEPAPLLVTRGFHWINEAPFNPLSAWGSPSCAPPRGLRFGFVGLGGLVLLQLLLDHLALERADEVDEQLAGQVVVLVEHAAREQRRALDLEQRAVEAHRADLAAHRPLDLDVDLGERQAAFLAVLLLVGGLDHLRIDEGERRIGLGPAGEPGLYDEHPPRIAQLERGDAEAVLGVHRVHEILVERTDRRIDGGDRYGGLPEPLVRPDHNGAHRHGATIGAAARIDKPLRGSHTRLIP